MRLGLCFFFLLCFFTAVLAVEKTSFHHKSRIRVTSKRSIAFWVCLWALRSIIAFSIKLSAIVCRIQLGGVSFRSYKDSGTASNRQTTNGGGGGGGVVYLEGNLKGMNHQSIVISSLYATGGVKKITK